MFLILSPLRSGVVWILGCKSGKFMLLETVFAGVFRRAKMGSNEAPSLPLGPENVRVEKNQVNTTLTMTEVTLVSSFFFILLCGGIWARGIII